MGTNGVVTRLAAKGEGPVCWTRQNEPVLLTIISNRLVLLDLLSGTTRQDSNLPNRLRHS